MGITVNTNLASIRAQRDLSQVTGKLAGNFARLSSGLRIASAADDAAGLAISERMGARITSMNAAVRNANDGISMVQTSEGALEEVSSIMTRLRELAVQSRNGTLSSEDRTLLDNEFSSLVSEVDRIANSTEFNGVAVLDGSTTSIDIQVGIGVSATNDRISVAMTSATSTALGINSLSITGTTNIDTAITTIDAALNTVNATRGSLGATQNRLESAINSLQLSVENLSASRSRIRDVDVAAETASLTRNLILQQSSAAILSQANLQPQIALGLLG